MQFNAITVMPDKEDQDEELLQEEEQEYVDDDPRERPEFGVEVVGQ